MGRCVVISSILFPIQVICSFFFPDQSCQRFITFINLFRQPVLVVVFSFECLLSLSSVSALILCFPLFVFFTFNLFFFLLSCKSVQFTFKLSFFTICVYYVFVKCHRFSLSTTLAAFHMFCYVIFHFHLIDSIF